MVAVSFIGGGNRRYPEKTTDLSQDTDKLYHKCWIEYISPLTGFEHTILVGIGTACTGSYTESQLPYDDDHNVPLCNYVISAPIQNKIGNLFTLLNFQMLPALRSHSS